MMFAQTHYENALGNCSRILLNNPGNEEEELHLLHQTLEHLLLAVDASRAYIFRNIDHPEKGFCLSVVAEVCAPAVRSQTSNVENQRFPWSRMPEEMHRELSAGRPFGGPVEVAFAGTPEWIEIFHNQHDPLLSLQQFPLNIAGEWWGFIGFDDCQRARQWNQHEIQLLSTAAEMFSSTLERWQFHAALSIQHRYQQALANCSRILLRNPRDKEQVQPLLDEAMTALVHVAGASRVYIWQNYQHPELGSCMRLFAEVCAEGVSPRIVIERNQRVLWNDLPQKWYHALRDGQPYGGPIEVCFASFPQLVKLFLDQKPPWRSMMTFPLHFGADWWGHIGFDDVNSNRHWTDQEVLLLRTASEMFSSALQRWEGHFVLEDRVKERTADLNKSNEQLRKEIEQRRQAEADLAQRLEIEQVLSTLSGRLIEYDNAEQALLDTLQDLGQLVNAQRALLIFINDEMNPFHAPVLQWSHQEKAPLPPDTIYQMGEDLPWLVEQMMSGRKVSWDSPDGLGSNTAESHQLHALFNVASLALFPMIVDGEVFAILAYSDTFYSKGKREEVQRILELGANLIESMVRREMILSSLERRVVDHAKELTTIFDITMLGGEAKNTSEFLEPAVRRLAETSKCQAVCVHVLSPDRETMILAAQVGIPEDVCENLTAISVDPTLSPVLRYTDEKALVGKRGELADLVATPLNVPDFATFFGSQLRALGAMVGFLSAYRTGEQPFRVNEISLLVVLAEQLGVLIENHRLQQQAEQMAIIGERQRLARELHDSITQSLYSQTFFARAARLALEDNDPERLEESLEDIELGTTNALKEMRLLLHQLKPFALERQSLPEAIEQRFDEVERRLGILATCQMPAIPEFDYETLAELHRIIMEALNNSLRHAQAEEVQVCLQVNHDRAKLIIADEGIGFDQKQITPGMGLAYMGERVRRIQGTIVIVSTPGEGTQITVEFPLETT